MNCTVQSCVSFVPTTRASPCYGRVLMFSLRTEIYVCAHARAAGRDTSHLIELVKINNMLQKFPVWFLMCDRMENDKKPLVENFFT